MKAIVIIVRDLENEEKQKTGMLISSSPTT